MYSSSGEVDWEIEDGEQEDSDSELTTFKENDDTEEDAVQDFSEATSFFQTHCYMLQALNNIPNAPPVTVTSAVEERTKRGLQRSLHQSLEDIL